MYAAIVIPLNRWWVNCFVSLLRLNDVFVLYPAHWYPQIWVCGSFYDAIPYEVMGNGAALPILAIRVVEHVCNEIAVIRKDCSYPERAIFPCWVHLHLEFFNARALAGVVKD